jgi:hypothetical protein
MPFPYWPLLYSSWPTILLAAIKKIHQNPIFKCEEDGYNLAERESGCHWSDRAWTPGESQKR